MHPPGESHKLWITLWEAFLQPWNSEKPPIIPHESHTNPTGKTAYLSKTPRKIRVSRFPTTTNKKYKYIYYCCGTPNRPRQKSKNSLQLMFTPNAKNWQRKNQALRPSHWPKHQPEAANFKQSLISRHFLPNNPKYDPNLNLNKACFYQLFASQQPDLQTPELPTSPGFIRVLNNNQSLNCNRAIRIQKAQIYQQTLYLSGF